MRKIIFLVAVVCSLCSFGQGQFGSNGDLVPLGNYAIVDMANVLGGARIEADTANLADWLKVGSIVFQTSNEKFYRFNAGTWEEIQTGAGGFTGDGSGLTLTSATWGKVFEYVGLGDLAFTPRVYFNGTGANSYAFPTNRGTVGQVLTASGTGFLTWGDIPTENYGNPNEIAITNGFGDGLTYSSALRFALGTLLINETVRIDGANQQTRDFVAHYINERGSAGSNIAGAGQIWVRDDSPNTLMFTDDAGTDHDLLSGGADGVVSNVSFTSPNLSFTGSDGGFNSSVNIQGITGGFTGDGSGITLTSSTWGTVFQYFGLGDLAFTPRVFFNGTGANSFALPASRGTATGQILYSASGSVNAEWVDLDFSLNGTSLESNIGGASVDLVSFLDNTDNQNASNVPVSPAVNGQVTVQASLEDHESRIDALAGGGSDGVVSNVVLNGTTLEFTGTGGGFNSDVALATLQDGFEANTDDQTIDQFNITSNTLNLSLEADGQIPQTVDLSPYLDNTDAQDLTLVGNTLAISGDPNTDVDLSGYLDNTDTQLNESQVESFIDGDEASFSGWDKNASDDFDGVFSSLTSIPAGLSDGDDVGILAETNDLSSVVTWANVPNGNITQASVTQHESSLSLNMDQVSSNPNTVASTASYTPTDANIPNDISALATNVTINAPTGSFQHLDQLAFSIYDDGTQRTITWNAIFNGTILPVNTTVGSVTYVFVVYNSNLNRWDATGVNVVD